MAHDPVETVHLHTADDLDLEGELNQPDGARAAVVLAHPHPAQGGSMRSLVTSELFRLLPEAGLAALRFNFRGVEGSQGTHGHGRLEHLDIEAAVTTLAERTPGLALVVAGWSFGADVALTVLDPRLAGWVLVAPPLRVVAVEAMVAAHDPRPKLLIVPEHDQFNPPEVAEPAVADWTDTEVAVVPGADHFFTGRTTRVAELAEQFVNRRVAPAG